MNGIAQEAFDAMVRHLTGSTVAMFGSYGLVVAPSEGERTSTLELDERSVVASIGYAGDNVRGALVLVATRSTVESWLTVLGEADGTADVCDTLGEFSNMLLGRLKGGLLSEGIPILLSTPTTASGNGLRLARPQSPSSLLGFDGPGWGIEVRLSATFEEGFAFQSCEGRGAVAEAGDMMMF